MKAEARLERVILIADDDLEADVLRKFRREAVMDVSHTSFGGDRTLEIVFGSKPELKSDVDQVLFDFFKYEVEGFDTLPDGRHYVRIVTTNTADKLVYHRPSGGLSLRKDAAAFALDLCSRSDFDRHISSIVRSQY